MKNVFIVFLIFVVTSFSSKNMVNYKSNDKLFSNIDPVILSQTYGYLMGIRYSLNRIKNEFPNLETEVLKCESAFFLAFGKAIERVSIDLQNLLGEKFAKYDDNLNVRLVSTLSEQSLSYETANNYLNEINNKAKGNIEYPVLQTLLTYQFIDNPTNEFFKGFTETYSTKGHMKSKGIFMNLKIPMSWIRNEGERPNIVHKFISENGNGKEIIIVLIKDLEVSSNYIISKEELAEFFIESELKKLVPAEGTYISARKIMIDNNIGGQVVFRTTQQRLDISIISQSIHYITIYKNKMVLVQCSVTAEENNQLVEKFDLMMPLFRQVANSVIFMDQY